MIKKELLKLTPAERDVIFLWRFLEYPKVLKAVEIGNISTHDLTFIKQTIHKFNRNCRLKLEAYQQQKVLNNLIESLFFD